MYQNFILLFNVTFICLYTHYIILLYYYILFYMLLYILLYILLLYILLYLPEDRERNVKYIYIYIGIRENVSVHSV